MHVKHNSFLYFEIPISPTIAHHPRPSPPPITLNTEVSSTLSNPSIHSLTNSYYGNTMYNENQSLPRESSENGGLSFVDSYLYRDISWTDNSFYTEKRTVNKHLSIVY